MVSKRYKQKLQTKDEFFIEWEEELDKLSLAIQTKIYLEYKTRHEIYNRDNFECQVEGCEFKESSLTMHHFKHKANGGKTSVRNCITVCRAHQNKYHKGQEQLKYKDNPSLPSHIRNATQVLDKYYNEEPEEFKIDWKIIRSQTKKLRKENKEHHGTSLTMEELIELFFWLFERSGNFL